MIYLIGGSGGPNFGDELIMLHWLRAYRTAGFHEPIVVDCKSVSNSLRLHRKPFVNQEHGHAVAEGALASPPDRNVRFVHLLKAVGKGKHGTLSDHAVLGQQFVRSNLRKFDGRDDPALDMSDCDVIHLIGGGYINGVWPSSGVLLGAASELSRVFGVPLVATGLGLEPLEDRRLGRRGTLVEILERFSLFECRDEGSFDTLAQALPGLSNLRLGLDDSFLAPVVSELSGGPRRLHISTYEKHADHFVGAGAVAGLKRCARDFDRVVFWEATPADGALVGPLREALGEVEVYDVARLLYGPPLVRAGDFLITSRFHPHLLAARMRAAGAYFANSNFYRSKHRGAVRLGSPFKHFQHLDQVDTTDAHGCDLPQREHEHLSSKRELVKLVMGVAGSSSVLSDTGGLVDSIAARADKKRAASCVALAEGAAGVRR